MYIVMTSSAKMPHSVRAPYRNVAVVEIDQHHTANGLAPKMISARAKGVLRVFHMGHHHVGGTSRSAYHRAVAEAERRANELNNASAPVDPATLWTWGGSA